MNMQCPLCGHSIIYKHGKTARGGQRYFCPACQQTFNSRRPRKKRVLQAHRFTWVAATVLLIGLIATSPLGANLMAGGLTVLLPRDSNRSVDAIVILGRGDAFRNSRIGTASQLWQLHRASKIFASGMNDARQIVEALEETGVPQSALAGETCSQSTEENALFTSAILYPQQVKSILLVTDSLHMLRSLLMFRSVGFDVVPHPTVLPQSFSSVQTVALALREYLGLLSYQLSGRFRVRSQAELELPPAEIKNKIVAWNCQLKN